MITTHCEIQEKKTHNPVATNKTAIIPRLIRLRNAPSYLGMNINLFNEVVRAELKHVPIGNKGIAFDRLELDAWINRYISENGYYIKTKKANILSVHKKHHSNTHQAADYPTNSELMRALRQSIK